MLVDVLRRRAADEGDRAVYLWEGGDEEDRRSWTFADLDREARRVGATLQAAHPPGTRGLLMCEPGLEYAAAFLGCLYAAVVPVPAYPPSPWMLERTIARLQAIAVDAEASFALTTSNALPLIEAADLRVEVDRRRLDWQCTDVAAAGAEDGWNPPSVHGHDVAFLQYTSGSTSAPKGVMVTHDNLDAQLDMIVSGYMADAETRGASWLPPYHDMGLVGGILAPIRLGRVGVLMSPETFLRRPIRWLRAISDHGANWSAAPDFAYELAVRRTTEAERSGLDLSSWTIAINGAEPVRARTVERFVRTFAPYGFQPHHLWPSYGLAETTLLTATGPLGRGASILAADADALESGRLTEVRSEGPRSRRLVSCGRPPLGARVIVVDPETRRPLSYGRVGEVWVAGPHVAAGYWGRPTESAEVFGAVTATGEGPFLRTGDLGAVHDGQLFITGRRQGLIVIRGRNHYPQDLEATVEHAHPDVRPGCVAAFAVTSEEGNDQLAVLLELRHELDDVAELAEAVGQVLSRDHRVRPDAVFVVPMRTIPKTSSGKIQRDMARDTVLSGGLEIVHQWVSPRWAPSVPRR